MKADELFFDPSVSRAELRCASCFGQAVGDRKSRRAVVAAARQAAGVA